ncbi:Sterol uptake control protein [Lachnellula suecica]|uniref:Sterol uptake control protein n=1 Tax=Lachnellula suecica TaxID=602035 RepID=A0A8T9C3K2_9HELO|nr:Sterol uptake control protein [Lachnellula suecica]
MRLRLGSNTKYRKRTRPEEHAVGELSSGEIECNEACLTKTASQNKDWMQDVQAEKDQVIWNHCDEQKPQCSNCIKHSVQCDFGLPPASSASPGGSFSRVGTPSSGTLHDSRRFNSPSAIHEPLSLNMLDLELLHNFSTSTCLTLHTNPSLRALWKVNVPRVGFSHDFVMRGILAVSALHMAHFVPEKKDFYVSQALIHHQSGLRVATSMLSNINDDNCSALYIFSALTLFVAVATPRKPGDFVIVGNTGLVDWPVLLKGTISIIASSQEALSKGVFSSMFKSGERRELLRLTREVKFHGDGDPLADLRDLVSQCQLDDHDFHAYQSAIEELRRTYALVYKQRDAEYEAVDVFTWLFKLTPEFLQLFQSRTQESLAIFTFFCVLLKWIDERWWLAGSGIDFLSQAYDLLDEEHRLWIRWPIEEMGKLDSGFANRTWLEINNNGPSFGAVPVEVAEHLVSKGVFNHLQDQVRWVPLTGIQNLNHELLQETRNKGPSQNDLGKSTWKSLSLRLEKKAGK